MTPTRRILLAAIAALSLGAAKPAVANDRASLRLNFLLSGVHTIFFLGKAQGAYTAEGIDLDIGEGQGSVRTVQTVATGGTRSGWRTAAVSSRAPRVAPQSPRSWAS